MVVTFNLDSRYPRVMWAMGNSVGQIGAFLLKDETFHWYSYHSDLILRSGNIQGTTIRFVLRERPLIGC